MSEVSSEQPDMTEVVHRHGWSIEETMERLRQSADSRDLIGAYEAAAAISRHVETIGGRSYLVGGAVRDELLDIPPHDFDLEVHGLTPEQLEPLLSEYGRPNLTGKSFGTYKVYVDGTEVQIALPRQDLQIGLRHNDVTVELHPEYTIPQAARRRDFTIGALYKDVLTGEISDPYHGIEDLETRTLRLVDERSFAEDPLRVIRGARFAAKFGLTVEPGTMAAMRQMVERVGVLPKERLREEWQRLLLEAEHPARGLELLREVGVIDRWHPEVAKLWQTPQHPRYHPEGNVGRHSLLTLDAAAELTPSTEFTSSQRLEILLGALTHDIGKPLVTTQDVDGVRSIGHERAGAEPAKTFLSGIGIPQATQERVIKLVTEHMRPAQLYIERNHVTDRALRKLARDVGPANLLSLITVSAADHLGRDPLPSAEGAITSPDTRQYSAWWEEQIERLQLVEPAEPILWGRDLVERGWQPGPHIGQVVRLAEDLRVDGMTRDEVLVIIDQAATPTEAVNSLQQRLTT